MAAPTATASTSVAEVLVAMSGGVDSTVAALLLQREGHDVAGITMKLFDDNLIGTEIESGCCSLDDVQDARNACRMLGIEHFTLNFKARFEHDVVERFCTAYLSGMTPNPCIDCNRYLKFAGLQQRRREFGAHSVATGHYARKRFNEATGKWELLRAIDSSKDQSYVLYHLTQDDLAHMLFPLGGLTKTQVRELARGEGFGNANKRESQDICFVPDGDYAAFIARYEHAGSAAPLDVPGAIVDVEGKKLGQHRGLIHYTTGQRKGIGVASTEPLYVLRKDLARNELVVGPRNSLFVDEIDIVDVNVISGERAPATHEAAFKTSYRQALVPGVIALRKDSTARVRFNEPIVLPAPGQAVVAYQGDVVLGGGTMAAPVAQ